MGNEPEERRSSSTGSEDELCQPTRGTAQEWQPIPQTLTGEVAAIIGNAALETFFSTIEIVNEENIPQEGPVILFGNHNNQFLDGALMQRTADRPVSFIAAEASFHRPVIGSLLHAVSALPVVRPEDRAYEGPGFISEIDEHDCTLRGLNTEFSKLQPGTTVGHKSIGQYVIQSVESDTELTFRRGEGKEENGAEGASSKGQLLPCAYKITPKIQHAEMFGKVTDALREGRCIGIFPEGGSHDRTEMLPLKAGVAIMALGALSEGIPVTIVPVGFNYFSGHVFRSTVFVDVGQPLQVAPELVALYKEPKTRKVACQQLLETMKSALDLVCLQAPDFATLKVIRTARRLYQGKVKLSPKEYMDLNIKFNTAYKLWKDEPEFATLMADIADYLELCRSQDLKDKQVRDMPPLGRLRTTLNALADIFRFACLVTVFLPLISPGLLLNWPLMWYIRKETPKEMARALSKSTVKVAARDVAASFQITTTIKLLPLMHLCYSCCWLVFFFVTWPYYAREPGTWGYTFIYNAWWFLPICFNFLGPYYSFRICPAMLEMLVRHWLLLPRYLLVIKSFFSRTARGPAEHLRLERKKLVIRVQDLVEKNIKSFPDFENDRVISRAKILQKRSNSIKNIARSGNLTPNLPRKSTTSVSSVCSENSQLQPETPENENAERDISLRLSKFPARPSFVNLNAFADSEE